MYGWSKFFVAGFLDDDLYFKENVLLFEITETAIGKLEASAPPVAVVS